MKNILDESSTFTFQLIILTFTVPLGLVVLSNVGLFLATVRAIKQQPSVPRSTARDVSNVYIYAKLSTITGLWWALVFLGYLPGEWTADTPENYYLNVKKIAKSLTFKKT